MRNRESVNLLEPGLAQTSSFRNPDLRDLGTNENVVLTVVPPSVNAR